MHNIRTALTSLLVLAMLLSGCGSNPARQISTAPTVQPPPASTNSIKQALYAQYREWKSVRYKDGGLSPSGVDCSGFVYLTYDERFDIKLPRSTEEQIHAGPEVSPGNLAPGDLVFFKTGRKLRHVGIYIEDGKFMHVSSTHGVMISNLDNDYWARAYWKAIHVRRDGDEVTSSR